MTGKPPNGGHAALTTKILQKAQLTGLCHRDEIVGTPEICRRAGVADQAALIKHLCLEEFAYRSTMLLPIPDRIPQQLKDLSQWLCWRLEPDPKGKLTKVPYNARTGRKGKSNDPHTWSSFATALAACQNGSRSSSLSCSNSEVMYDGIGLAFDAGDGLVGIDLDSHKDREGRELAQAILERFSGTYCERSPSGKGYRIFALGTARRCGKGTSNKWIEIYDHGSPRYLTVTGAQHGAASEITAQPTALAWLHDRFFKDESTPSQQTFGTSTPNAVVCAHSDEEVIEKIRSAANGNEFKALFDSGGWKDLGFPSQSEADYKLCWMLGFYTQTVEQIDNIFRRSALMRPKWDSRRGKDSTYGQDTIHRALANVNEMYPWDLELRRAQGARAEQWAIDGGKELALSASSQSEEAMAGQANVDIGKTKFNFPNADPFTEDQLARAQLTPPCIVDQYLYHDVAILAGAGASNKTTIALWESAHIALGRTLYGLETNQSRTLFVTGEDNSERLAARLRELIKEMDLGANERKAVLDGVRVLDLVGKDFRFCDVEHGSITTSDQVNRLIDKFDELKPGIVYFDPLASFGPPEELGNSGFQGVINAARRITQNMKCCVRIVHHTGQESYRTMIRDQYSMRGATSLSDGSRMVAVLTAAKKDDHSPFGNERSSLVLSRPKLSFCKPQGEIFIKRDGFRFEYAHRIAESSHDAQKRRADQVELFLISQLKEGIKFTASELDDCLPTLDMKRAELRKALSDLRSMRRVCDEPLPKKAFVLFRRTLRRNSGEFWDKFAKTAGLFRRIYSAKTIPPPYSVQNGGGIAASVLHAFTT